eukprot:scaffold67692_cov52-Phaeocystis_antarctica.AAC.1
MHRMCTACAPHVHRMCTACAYRRAGGPCRTEVAGGGAWADCVGPADARLGRQGREPDRPAATALLQQGVIVEYSPRRSPPIRRRRTSRASRRPRAWRTTGCSSSTTVTGGYSVVGQ